MNKYKHNLHEKPIQRNTDDLMEGFTSGRCFTSTSRRRFSRRCLQVGVTRNYKDGGFSVLFGKIVFEIRFINSLYVQIVGSRR